MKRHHTMRVLCVSIGIGAVTGPVFAQPTPTVPGPSVPGTANPNNAVEPQGISPPVSGNFGLTPSPGATMTPGYSPGAKPPGVGSGAGPGLSSGAPFSGTGYGTNSLGRTSPDAGGTIPSLPSQSTLPGAQGGMMSPGGRSSTGSSVGTNPGAGAPGPSMGTTPSSGSMAPGAGGSGGGR